jgi:hypothetical protein
MNRRTEEIKHTKFSFGNAFYIPLVVSIFKSLLLQSCVLLPAIMSHFCWQSRLFFATICVTLVSKLYVSAVMCHFCLKSFVFLSQLWVTLVTKLYVSLSSYVSFLCKKLCVSVVSCESLWYHSCMFLSPYFSFETLLLIKPCISVCSYESIVPKMLCVSVSNYE